MNKRSGKGLIRGAFLRLMANNIFIFVATCACGVVDNLFVGRTLGQGSLAAMGFFSPIMTAAGLSYVPIMGAQVLAGNYIGEGKTERVNKLFVSVFFALFAAFTLFSTLCVLFRAPLANILGARGDVAVLLCDYITGYAPGIVPQTLAALLMALCSYNNDLKRSYYGIAAMIVGNALGDMLLVGPLGLLGIGIASSISSAASFMVLLPGFLKKNKLFYFDLSCGFDPGIVLNAVLRGLPSLTFTIGVIFKNYCFNYAMNEYAGAPGVAVAGIMSAACALFGAIPTGCANAFSSLAGLYYGEQDRESYLDLARTALKTGVAAATLCAVAVALFSGPLTVLFLPGDVALHPLCGRMFSLAFSFLLPNVIYNIFVQSYSAQGKMTFINIMSFAEVASVGLFALLAMRWLGTDAAWIANAAVDVLCIFVLTIPAAARKKTLRLSLPAMLNLDDDFGADEEDVLERSITAMDEVVKASSDVAEFCRERKYPPRTAYYVALSVEEIASNILKYGFQNTEGISPKGGGAYYTDVRIVAGEEALTVRFRDNCREFDLRERLKLYAPETRESHIGIRMVAKIAKQIDYYNNAGVNTTIAKF